MLTRVARGTLPEKPHTALRENGALLYEHCLTRQGFDGPYTILYHKHRPQAFEHKPCSKRWVPLKQAEAAKTEPLARRHLKPLDEPLSGDSLEARLPLLFNDDVVVSRRSPTLSDAHYFVNADADELLYIQRGTGQLSSWFGELRFEPRDYVFIPKGVPHRFELEDSADWLSIELRSNVAVPGGFRNDIGQLRMDAPYSLRDFRLPEFRGVVDHGFRDVVVKRDERLFQLHYEHTPLDVVGYDGSIFPFAFPIERFQARVGAVHLPPTIHGTFEARGVLICSFVPRPLDFRTDAIPCPYPHSSVDIDEVLFYSAGDFASRKGVGPGSISWHPRGIPHGPQPRRYEESVGKAHTDELAVMLDCAEPLKLTESALATLDSDYDQSFSTT